MACRESPRMNALFSMGLIPPQLKDKRRFATMAGPAKTMKAPTTTGATHCPAGDACIAEMTGACGHEDADRATIGVVDGVQLGVLATPCPADQTAPLATSPLFRPHSGRRAMRLEVGRVNHHALWNSGPISPPINHPGKDPLVAPPLSAVLGGLRQSIFLRCITPPQTKAIDDDYPLSTCRSSTRALPWILGKTGGNRATCTLGSQKRLSIRQSPYGG